jgi:hypothetical protein
MHCTIVRSAQSQADELEAAKARIRALEKQLRVMGVEPTTEHAYAEPTAGTIGGETRDFTVGNNQIRIQPGPGSSQAAALTAGVTETAVRRKSGNQAPQKQSAATQPADGTKVVDDARLRASLIELK